MPWAETQAAFAEAMLGVEAPAEPRLQIYRDNVTLTLQDALAETYSSIRALVGDDYFAQLSQRYIVQHPPERGDLNAYGLGFARFIETHPVADQLPYLPDVARYEWAFQQSYYAPEMRGEGGVNPNLKLLRSTYDASALWRFCVREAGQGEPPAIQPGEHYVALSRSAGNRVYTEVLSADQYRCLQALLDGQVLEEALGLLEEDAIAPFASLLFERGWVISMETQGEHT